MTFNRNFWTALAVLFAVVCTSPVYAENGKRGPLLKPLTPQVDLSNEPDPSDLFDQAVKEYAAGHLPRAEQLFEKVIELDWTNADAHFNLGAIKEWRNDWTSALTHYKAAAKAKPGDAEIADAVRTVEYKIKNRTLIESQTAKIKKERDMATHSKLAKEAFSNENYAEAIIHLSYLAEAMPDDPKIHFALGQSLRALKNFDWAAYRLKMAIYLDPDNDLYRKTLVELDREMQDIQGQAYTASADIALSRMANFQFHELADIGLGNAF